MAYNLFVSYDLNKPGEKPADYDRIAKAIAALGPSVRVQKSLWYVKASVNAAAARDKLKTATDSTDYLIVVEAKDAAWTQLMPGAADSILKHWKG